MLKDDWLSREREQNNAFKSRMNSTFFSEFNSSPGGIRNLSYSGISIVLRMRYSNALELFSL